MAFVQSLFELGVDVEIKGETKQKKHFLLQSHNLENLEQIKLHLISIWDEVYQKRMSAVRRRDGEMNFKAGEVSVWVCVTVALLCLTLGMDDCFRMSESSSGEKKQKKQLQRLKDGDATAICPPTRIYFTNK